MKKTFAALGLLSFMLGGPSLAQTVQGKAELVVDTSTSMKQWVTETRELVRKVKNYLEKKGISSKLYSFGANIKPLESVSSLKADELDTNYAALLKHLENSQDTLAIVITDGKVPTKRIKDISKIKEEGANLNDAGNVICTITVKEPTDLVKSFSAVSGSFKDYRKVLDKCVSLWETLQQNKTTLSTSTPTPPPSLIKVVNERGFRSLEAQKSSTRVEASGTQVEIIIKPK